ncbi:WXG100 family type VII secretion target [Dactylosporangium sp. CA-092794]|uniref:WXG100 family type VII secretion target n=1 Tax=Dactylosporangium sp. CA-092794 TaxID=3239929 RepID=UPI003D8E1562
MAYFEVTPEALQQGASSCESSAGQISDQLNALKSYVLQLGEEWLGMTAQEFTLLMDQWDAHSRTLHTALVGIADGLRKNAGDYAEHEGVNLTNVTSIAGSLPALRV